MSGLNKARRDFIAHILNILLAFPGKRTTLNSARRAAYCEKSICLDFSQVIDCQLFKIKLVGQTHHEFIIVLAPNCLPKSSTKTQRKGRFWSGVAGKTLAGLEFCGISLIDTQARTALHYRAFQTPNKEELNERGMDFHVNTSLTAVYAAKVQYYYDKKDGPKPVYSLLDIRNRLMNEMMLKRFISVFGIRPDTEENKEKIRRLLLQGQIAA